MATPPKPVTDRAAEEQAITLKNGSQVGGGWAIAPQTKQTTTGGYIRGGKVSGPIKTDKC